MYVLNAMTFNLQQDYRSSSVVLAKRPLLDFPAGRLVLVFVNFVRSPDIMILSATPFEVVEFAVVSRHWSAIQL